MSSMPGAGLIIRTHERSGEMAKLDRIPVDVPRRLHRLSRRHGRPAVRLYDAGDVDVPTARPDMTWRVDPASAALLRELMSEVRVLFIGRRFFEMMDGWGGQHPFGAGIPIIVPVTTVPDGWPRTDRPDVIFVTDGLDAAVASAHEIAGDGIVGVGGAPRSRPCSKQVCWTSSTSLWCPCCSATGSPSSTAWPAHRSRSRTRPFTPGGASPTCSTRSAAEVGLDASQSELSPGDQLGA